MFHVLNSAGWNGDYGRPQIKKREWPDVPTHFIVDDEPILLELAESVLRGLEYDIQTFTNPELALHTYSTAEKPPDLIITDFAMHEMDGLNLIRQCRRLHPQQKILLVSGTVDESVFFNSAVKPDRFWLNPTYPRFSSGWCGSFLTIDVWQVVSEIASEPAVLD